MTRLAPKDTDDALPSVRVTLLKLQKIIGASGHTSRQRDTERAQSIVRMILPPFVMLYLLVGVVTGAAPEPAGAILVSYFFVFFIISAALYLAIVRRPGVNHPRRAFAMALDYGSLTFSMILGSAYLAPLYALLIWVTVGYGMRYGSRYLRIATLLALLSLVFVVSLSGYWRGQPYIVATLFVTAIIVPFYAHILLAGMREAYQQASAANLAKSRFLAQASHDLRQPVHAISLFTACLRDADIGADERSMVENIDRSLHSVARLFRSLLDVATLDSGKVSPKIEVVELGPLLTSIAEQNVESARWANVSLRVVPTSVRVRVDPNLLTIILQNLVSNAFKYASNGPVLIGCRRCGKTVSIVVQDSGRGIPEKDRARVFDEFYRANVPGSDVEGVGLGLSIVRRMATLMGLDVSLTSQEGAGTSVRVEGLPVTLESVASRKPASTPPVTLLHGMRILLIEDDLDVLSATRTLLEKWGCEVRAERGAPIDGHDCDLILADFDLNDELNGADCVAHVRSKSGRDIPAIFMTGHDNGWVSAELGDISAPILSKPVRPAELRASLLAQRLRMVGDAPKVR